MAISSGRAQNNRVPQLAQLGLVRNLHPPETKIEDKTLRVVSLPGLALSSGHTYTWSTFAHQDILEMEGECECESAAARVRGGPHTLTLILIAHTRARTFFMTTAATHQQHPRTTFVFRLCFFSLYLSLLSQLTMTMAMATHSPLPPSSCSCLDGRSHLVDVDHVDIQHPG